MHLHLTDYRSPTQWRWRLDDERGSFLADHQVNLDANAAEYRGLTDLPGFLEHYGGAFGEIRPYADLLEELGAWMGERLFGGLREVLLDHQSFPSTAIHCHLPAAAQALIQAPLELAHLDGQPLARQGIRLVYQVEADPARANPQAKPGDGPLRVLAVFSLPDDETPLNLRRERYLLRRLLDSIAHTRGQALELRVLQYGATRHTLKEALKEGRGWDLIHFSGHGLQGQILLEDDAGHTDRIATDDLKSLLRPAKRRLKLLTLSACHSGSNLRASDLLSLPNREARENQGATDATQAQPTAYPGLAQELADGLDCAVLAMRYPVGDQFAVDLGLALYQGLLQHGQPLPGALHQALEEGLAGDAPPLSLATPILFGPAAAALQLQPPPGDGALRQRSPAPGAGFPPEPERFVGRLQLLLEAGRALAPRSPARGVLFHGMAGGGKTACALELAWRHERDRFTRWVWHKAPDQDADIRDALGNLLVDLENQLELPPGDLIPHLQEPALFKARTLPHLTQLLNQHAVCICLDNLEGLLSDADEWRDPRWGDLLQALLTHRGESRLILTSRRVPRTLADQTALIRLPVHTLRLEEAALLLREMEHTSPLFADGSGRALLRRLLAVVQGHPKLLELADRLAADRSALAERLGDAPETPEVRTFFETGESTRDEAEFVQQLGDWAEAALRGLDPQAQRLMECLARMEEPDRESGILEAVWDQAMGEPSNQPPAGSEPAGGLAAPPLGEMERQTARRDALHQTLQALAQSGLVELRPVQSPVDPDAPPSQGCALHPAIAERLRALAEPEALARLDQTLGGFWRTRFEMAQMMETQGQGRALTTAARRACPYLLRRDDWKGAATLLEQLIYRDASPATIAFALPLLERIAEATAGTDEGFENQGVLARTLRKAGRYVEAEGLLRQGMGRAATAGRYRLASNFAGDLLNLLMDREELDQALDLAVQKADYTHRAGLGPWSQLLDEAQRLQVLNAQGRWREVLDRVEELRPRLEELPDQGEAEETAIPWNVREGLLNTAWFAAKDLKDWPLALSLNAECLRFRVARAADPAELARVRFNDYFPLLRLGRLDECRTLLEGCRQAFAAGHAILELGAVYTAFADLEDREGRPDRAAVFGQGALKYSYQAGLPKECAISHNDLANYLQRGGAPAARVLAHRLAAVTINYQTGSGYLRRHLENLANTDRPPHPPAFAEVAAEVERLEGVRFGDLFAALPARAPNGDAAIAAVWAMALERRQAREGMKRQLAAALTPELRAALESGDEAALQQALGQLDPEQLPALLEQLMGGLPEEMPAQMAPARQGPDMERVLEEWAPLLQAIAAVAQGDEAPRSEIESLLPQLEAQGWRLTAPVQAIWSCNRDPERLIAGIDPNSAQLVRRILELIAG